MKRVLLYSLLGIALAAVALVAVAFYIATDGPKTETACEHVFTPERWQSALNQPWETYRQRFDDGERSEPQVYADDLIACDTLVGLKRAKVVEMLGEPRRSRGDSEDEHEMTWVTGLPRAGFQGQTDVDILEVRFDGSGEVVSVSTKSY